MTLDDLITRKIILTEVPLRNRQEVLNNRAPTSKIVTNLKFRDVTNITLADWSLGHRLGTKIVQDPTEDRIDQMS